jgi:hypothetical protein
MALLTWNILRMVQIVTKDFLRQLKDTQTTLSTHDKGPMYVMWFMYCIDNGERFILNGVTPSKMLQNTVFDSTGFPSVHTIYIHES